MTDTVRQSSDKRVIEAEEFVLVDSAGRQRAKLGFSEDGEPRLILIDAKDVPRVGVGFSGETPKIVLFDQHGILRARVEAKYDEPHIEFWNADGSLRWSAP